jgi:hypothetical protein
MITFHKLGELDRLVMFQNLSIHNSDHSELNGYRDLTEFTVLKDNKIIK